MNTLNKIFIPTDFSIKSLSFVIDFLKNNSTEKFDLVLLHGYELPQNISDLLFFSKSKLLKKLQTTEFEDTVRIIKNRFESNINSISIDFVMSDSKSYIKNYIEAQKPTQVVTIDNYSMTFKDKNSFDINNLLKIIATPVYKITHQENKHILSNTELVSDVFVIN